MRKLVVGMLIGAALTFGIQAGASGLLSKGDKVANVREVTFNGKTVGNAAIVNDSSLVPVRPISEALGLDINFDGGKINLSSPSTPEPTPSSGPAATPTPGAQQYTMEAINLSILGIENQIKYFSASADQYEKDGQMDIAKTYREYAEKQKAELVIWQQRKAELEGK
ncbi:copper amine oxidase N-terminal domain-containing protein [Cohnella sp. GbtcB17]|uniref:copper amine oxidase N-terminal domain-containing protein n=1 Tax=Cohnella sp. GbtcB17 TaxID=2824762 RepID=UPI001C2F9A3A|nr:copper amine oxidase N-terminal domain-containing protein [Cohnella sp. GbtcB17]